MVAMTKHQVEQLQQDLNRFTDKFLFRVGHLRVDGVLGPATRKRIVQVKFWLGYAHKRMNHVVDDEFRARLERPRHRGRLRRGTRKQRRRAVLRGIKRRRRQRKLARESYKKAQNWRQLEGFDHFDGETVPAWTVPWLEKSRAHRCPRHPHGWQGHVVSGVRTPEYSEHLCFSMCGHPTCPGRCAGRGSNHNMEPDEGYPKGALDVNFYGEFGEIQHEIDSPLRNDLPRDLVHFSVSGR